METATYILFIVLAFYFFAQGRQALAFAMAGLCMLTRLDGAMVVAVLAAVAWWRDGRFPWRPLIAPVVVNAAWLGFAWIYFGFPLPNSFLAKQFHTDHHFSHWMVHVAAMTSPTLWLLALVGLAAVMLSRRDANVESTSLVSVLRNSELLPLLLWACGYILAYTVSELEEYLWYVAPLIVALVLFAANGAGWIADRIFAGGGVAGRRFAAPAVVAIALLPALDAIHQPFAYAGLEAARHEGALYAVAHVPKNAVIASAGIGMVGWYTNNPIIDAAGLVSPEVLHRFPRPFFYHSFAAIAVNQKPEYLFDAAEADVGWPPSVQANYHRVATFATRPQYSDFYKDFVLWKRN